MLAQAARSASRLSIRQPHIVARHAPITPMSSILRTYSKYSKPSFNDQQSSSQTPAGSARQTSPGTSFPKDQTWKPKDSINFGGAAPAQPTPPEVSESSEQTAEFNKEADPNSNTAPTGQPGPNNENEQDIDETPKGPLPDLRQGIPSTFDIEFGKGKVGAGADDASGPSGADEGGFPGSGKGRRKAEGEEEFNASDYETSTDRTRAKLARYMYASLATILLVGSGYFGRPYEKGEGVPSGVEPADLEGWSPGAVFTRIKSRMTGSVEYYTEPTSRKLLPEMPGQQIPYTLVLSLEDLLIHSEWSREHGWRTAKRPGVDYFLRYLSQYFELVIFTTVPSAMGDPVIRKLDPFRIVMWPLFREATKYENGKYIKDLAYLNRPLDKTLIIDTNPDHVSNQPENAIVLPKWKGDPKDEHAKDLVGLIPFLEYIAATNTPDVRKVIGKWSWYNLNSQLLTSYQSHSKAKTLR